MELVRAGTQESMPGRSEYFTGTVWLDRIIQAPAPARVRALRVSFMPGARTAWHTHPLGQTLHVLTGTGLFQTEGQPGVVIRPGDTVWIPPGEKHWHGAGPATTVVHLAIQEGGDAGETNWMEKVTDEDYAAVSAIA
ncbi:(R)-mandelonitrile lyase [Geminicoccus roseus]|uniref:(R)-mandelonitrile lyase n=1 Tax=Geminicoccus roseus TaxID=404900 RepID=UPI0004197BC1|nr:cupin domain-containing protein [Geminicoccus roseus]